MKKKMILSLDENQIKILDEALSSYRNITMGRVQDALSGSVMSGSCLINDQCEVSNLIKSIDKKVAKIDESDAPDNVKTINEIQHLVRSFRGK